MAAYSSIPAWENPWAEELGYSSWDCKELEWLSIHSHTCIHYINKIEYQNCMIISMTAEVHFKKNLIHIFIITFNQIKNRRKLVWTDKGHLQKSYKSNFFLILRGKDLLFLWIEVLNIVEEVVIKTIPKKKKWKKKKRQNSYLRKGYK